VEPAVRSESHEPLQRPGGRVSPRKRAGELSKAPQRKSSNLEGCGALAISQKESNKTARRLEIAPKFPTDIPCGRLGLKVGSEKLRGTKTKATTIADVGGGGSRAQTFPRWGVGGNWKNRKYLRRIGRSIYAQKSRSSFRDCWKAIDREVTGGKLLNVSICIKRCVLGRDHRKNNGQVQKFEKH